MKRANGTGSIVKLSGHRRNPYSVRVSGTDRFGQIIQKSIGYYRTASEAQEALDEYNRRKKVGETPKTESLNITVQQIYDAWSAHEFKHLKPASVSSHQAAWNQRVSRFSDRKMRDMTLDEWQSILDEDEDAGKSQSLINNDAILIKALYTYAMERDIVMKDYSAYLDIPSVNPKRANGAFSDLQIHELVQLANNGFPWADTALILCYTGFRISELLELTKKSYHEEHGGYLQGGKKTASGKNRIIPVHPKIKPFLANRLLESTDMIISNNGTSLSSDWYRRNAFPPIATQLNCPNATPHWCRHTFATMLHNAGCDSLTTKWLMGHSTATDITARYTHENIEKLRQAVLKLT